VLRRRLFFGATALMGVLALLPASAGAALPDGRAYEQVSPANKGGAVLSTNESIAQGTQALAISDTNITFPTALTAFPDPNGGPLGLDEFDFYNFTRTGSPAPGWTYTPLQPAEDLPQYATSPTDTVDAVSSDFSTAVLNTYAGITATTFPELDDTQNLSIFTNNGTTTATTPITPQPPITNVGAYNQPFFYGASASLNHVVYGGNFQLSGSVTTAGANTDLYDYTGGQLLQVDLEPGGGQFPGGVDNLSLGAPGSVSANGSSIYFSAGGLLYLRQNDSSTVEIAPPPTSGDPSCVTDGGSAPDTETFQGASPDGSTAYFTSDCALTTAAQAVPSRTDASPDLYAYTVANGTLTDLSIDSTSGDHGTANVQGLVGTSTNASYVYFVADGRLVAGKGTDNGPNTSPNANLYVYHAGTVTFLATLSVSDSGVWISGAGQYRSVQVTPDGQYVLLESLAGLTSGNFASHEEVYELGAGGNSTLCVSCDPSGTPNGQAGSLGLNSISQDDSRIFFQTTSPLVTGDSNAVSDVYEYENGQLSLISAGAMDIAPGSSELSAGSTLVGASPSGDNVYFTTFDQLVGQDQDDELDLYDARVGGVSQPAPVGPTPCAQALNGSCQPTQTALPTLPQSVSAAGSDVTTVTTRNATTQTVPAATASVGAISAQSRSGFARSGVIKLPVKLSAATTVRLVATAKIAGHKRTVGTASRAVSKGGTVTITLSLSKQARQVLAAGRSLVVTISFTPKGGKSRTVTLTLKRGGK